MNDVIHLLNPWWQNESFETGIIRNRYIDPLWKTLSRKQSVLIVGSRRVGKTTLLLQIIQRLLQHTPPDHILYLLLDHPQLSQHTIMGLVDEFRGHFRLHRKEKIYLFLDEIQYIDNWEQEVKALADTENVKIFLSGSASSELLTKKSFLTGRIETHMIYPLDFPEFLQFKKFKIAPTETYKYKAYCDEYLKTGGYPEYILSQNPAYFSDLINDILYKDILRMYSLKNPDVLKDLLLLLADRVGHQTTFTKLGNILSVKNDTIKEYIYYLKNTFLVDELPRYATSRAKRIYAAKKYYIADNGILFHLLAKLSYGAAFERTLYEFLRETNKSVLFYVENQKEVDFIVEHEKGKELWEAKYALQGDIKDEVKKYIPIASMLESKTITIVTSDVLTSFTTQNISVHVIPLWKLLLKQSSMNKLTI